MEEQLSDPSMSEDSWKETQQTSTAQNVGNILNGNNLTPNTTVRNPQKTFSKSTKLARNTNNTSPRSTKLKNPTEKRKKKGSRNLKPKQSKEKTNDDSGVEPSEETITNAEETLVEKMLRLSRVVYPGVICGHKHCNQYPIVTPKNMGWLWSVKSSAGVKVSENK